jgi:hypothetical protein
MTIIKPIIFGSLILAALSVTQMDAFARGREGGHEGPRPEHFEHQEVPHTLNKPEAHPSGPATSETQVSRPKGPEVVTPGGVISQEVVVPEGATVTLPGSKDQLKTETSGCWDNPACTK